MASTATALSQGTSSIMATSASTSVTQAAVYPQKVQVTNMDPTVLGLLVGGISGGCIILFILFGLILTFLWHCYKERQTKTTRKRLFSEGEEEEVYERSRRRQVGAPTESLQPPSRENTDESAGTPDGQVVVHGMPVSRENSSIDPEDERHTNRTEDENEQRGVGAQQRHSSPNAIEVPPLQLTIDERVASPTGRRNEPPSSLRRSSQLNLQQSTSPLSGQHRGSGFGPEVLEIPTDVRETQRDVDGGTSWRALDSMVRRPEVSSRPGSAFMRPAISARDGGALSPGAVSLRSAAQGGSLTPVGH